MSDILNVILIVLLAVIGIGGLIFLGWWLLIASEGVYLGRRVVILLYDWFAPRYDGVKGFRREYEHRFLAQPIMQEIAPEKSPLMLDVATGTGRLPLAMIRHPQFSGRVIGIDLSLPMLRHALPKFSGDARVLFAQSPAERVPFADDTFDVVTCLEALEFVSDQRAALAEMFRVLKPGGMILITHRINTRWLPRKTYTRDHYAEMLLDAGFDEIRFKPWQVDYQQVWGIKPALRGF